MAAAASFQCPCELHHDTTGPECQPAFHRLRLWGLALGPASPCADCHGAGTLGLTVSGVFTLICAYSFRHPHFWSLHTSFATTASQFPERSPTPCLERQRPSFGGPLNPDHSRRIHAGRVSYYALFKGMAASKPTSSLSRHGHILRYTQRPLRVFGVWLGLVGASLPRAHPVALPPADIIGLRRSRGSTSIDFGENQLSPGLIGLSPLPTSHPSGFQPTPVRASTGCYPSFTLLPTPSLQDSLSLRLRRQPA